MNWITLISGGLAGGFLTAWVNMQINRRMVVHSLLQEGLEIYALPEAWILEGQECEQYQLSQSPGLPTKDPHDGGKPWLRSSEVRVAFDRAKWNRPEYFFYGMLGDPARRTWIVRDKITTEKYGRSRLFRGEQYSFYSRQALLSSKAMDNLCGWIERVAYAYSVCLIPRHGLRVLEPVLESVSREDVAYVLRERLTPKARHFLKETERWYEKEHPRA